MIFRISSSASKTVAKPSRMWMRFSRRRARAAAARHDLQPEVEEVPEDRLEIEALRPADLGVLGRHEAGEVEAKLVCSGVCLKRYAMHLLLVGFLLQLELDAHVGAGTSFTSTSSGIARDMRPRRCARRAPTCSRRTGCCR